jgi:hypothetical protein
MLKKISNTVRAIESERREKKKENTRSPRWSSVRDKFLKKNTECAACGHAKRLQVHHKVPFNENPLLELVESNLIVLCMGENECHLRLGHGGNYDYWNPEIEVDVKIVSEDLTTMPLMKEKAKNKRKPNDPTLD